MEIGAGEDVLVQDGTPVGAPAPLPLNVAFTSGVAEVEVMAFDVRLVIGKIVGPPLTVVPFEVLELDSEDGIDVMLPAEACVSLFAGRPVGKLVALPAVVGAVELPKDGDSGELEAELGAGDEVLFDGDTA